MAASPLPGQADELGRAMEIEEDATKRARRASASGDGRWPSDADADRLSALPDSLLHAIMSFLKARQAVQTCVLATRWRHLWRSVPCLDVDHDEFIRSTAAAAGRSYMDRAKDWEREWSDFEDFTVSLLRRCDVAQLDSLSLRVTLIRAPRFADRQAGGWLRRAMKYRRSTADPDGSWRLKRLYLGNVALDSRFEEHLRSACRSLEDLELDFCAFAFQAIASGSLKTLVLKNCSWHYLSEITSPTLKRLVVTGGSIDARCVVVAPAIAHLCLDVPLYFARSISVNPQAAKALLCR